MTLIEQEYDINESTLIYESKNWWDLSNIAS